MKLKTGKIFSTFKLLVLLTAIAFIVNSCRKDVLTNQQQGVIDKPNEDNLDIKKLQDAYKAGIKQNATLKTNDLSHKTLSDIVGTLDVDWSTYTLQNYADSNRVVEFEMPRDTSIFTLGNPSPGDTLQYKNKTKAVFILHKDTLKLAFFMKIIEDLTAPNSKSTIDNLLYQQIPSSFTGQIMYFSLDKKFINGFNWKNGSIVNTLSPLVASQQTTQNVKTPKPNLVSYVCHSVQVKYLIVHISDVYLPSMHVDVYFTVETGYIDVCGYEGTFDGGGLSGSGGVSSDGGGGGDGGSTGTSPSNPCPSTAVAYVKGKRVNLLPGGGSGCPVVPPTTIPPNNTIIVKPDLDEGLLNDDIVLFDPTSSVVYQEYQNQQPWPTINRVIAFESFVPMRFDANGKAVSCLQLAREQLAKAGYTCSGWLPNSQTFQIYTSANGVNQSKTRQAITYLISALSNNTPVIIGVDRKPGSINYDDATDHFVVVNGMGSDANGKYFTFIDNSTSDRSTGASYANKLYYNPTTGKISGETQSPYGHYPGSHDYIVTQVRKSIKL